MGITRGTGLGHIARATVEAIAHQVVDVVQAMEADTGQRLRAIRVDGGAARNDDLLQLQADLLDIAVERPVVSETTALGAAYLAGLAVGYWSGTADIRANWALDRRFEPSMSAADRGARRRSWARGVDRVRGWAGGT
jgi:glycerol kinase